MIEAHALREFRWRVPMHEECHHPRPGATLAQTEKCPYRIDLFRMAASRD